MQSVVQLLQSADDSLAKCLRCQIPELIVPCRQPCTQYLMPETCMCSLHRPLSCLRTCRKAVTFRVSQDVSSQPALEYLHLPGIFKPLIMYDCRRTVVFCLNALVC